MTTFFGFALADSMMTASGTLRRYALTADEAKGLLALPGVVPCLNPSHKATINAMQARYGIDVAIPATAPQVVLGHGDKLIVMGVRGLPRLDATRHEYTNGEISSASFTFSLYTWQKDNA
jgi:hypothetical protein